MRTELVSNLQLQQRSEPVENAPLLRDHHAKWFDPQSNLVNEKLEAVLFPTIDKLESACARFNKNTTRIFTLDAKKLEIH